MKPSWLVVSVAAGAMVAAAVAAGIPARASSTASALEPVALARAQAIRAEMNARYRLMPGHKLAVTEATTTDVVESFALLTPDLLEMRFVPADNGIYYAICSVRATCPYPVRRFARPAADLVPRRLALELALRTFRETTANVVAVSLPTPRFSAFVVERDELARQVDLATLGSALEGDASRSLSASLEDAVDRVTRPRIFLFAGLEPTPTGRDRWAGVPRWPSAAGPAAAPALARPESLEAAASSRWT
jgi:hypothetical protein